MLAYQSAFMKTNTLTVKTNWYTFLSRYTSNGVWVYLGKILPQQAIESYYFWSALKWLNKSLGSHFSRPPFQASRLLLEAMWKERSQKWLPKQLQTHGLCSLLFYYTRTQNLWPPLPLSADAAVGASHLSIFPGANILPEPCAMFPV